MRTADPHHEDVGRTHARPDRSCIEAHRPFPRLCPAIRMQIESRPNVRIGGREPIHQASRLVGLRASRRERYRVSGPILSECTPTEALKDRTD